MDIHSKKAEEILSFYCENEMFELRKICDPIIKMKNVPQMDVDDLYSDALKVLHESVLGFQEGKDCSFKTFLTGNIKRSFYDWTRDQNRQMRCNLIPDIDEETGEQRKDKNGKLVFKKVHNICIDEENEDGLSLKETIPSDYDIYKEMKIEDVSSNTEEYIRSLGQTERKIAALIMEGDNPQEIKEVLGLTDNEFSKFMSDMRSYDRKKVLKRDIFAEKNDVLEEDKIMVTTTSEKTKNTSFSLEAIAKKLKKHQIRDNHPLQRHSGQWNNITRSELMSDIMQGKSLIPIIISEEIKGTVIMHWLIDGKQRCTNTLDFMDDGFAISKNVQIYDIQYQTDKVDENGNVVYNEDGFPIPEMRSFDIRGKKFSQLPEELQDKIKEYQMPVMLNLNCTKRDIAYDIARFNRCRPMNVAQNGWTGITEEYAEYVDKILGMDFFKIDCEKSSYTKSNEIAGSLRRMIVTAIMVAHYIDHYSKDFHKMCEFLSREASATVFINAYVDIERLTACLTKETASLFNIKNSYLWFALFDYFTSLDIPDEKFSEFLIAFQNDLHNVKVDGLSYDELDQKGSTTNKTLIMQKMNHLKTLLNGYLHIEAVNNSDDSNTGEDPLDYSVIDFVRTNVNPEATEEDIDDCFEMLDGYKEIEGLNKLSKLWDYRNELSLIALVAYSFKNDIDLDDWIVKYTNQEHTYSNDQKENYISMKKDLDEFRKGNAA